MELQKTTDLNEVFKGVSPDFQNVPNREISRLATLEELPLDQIQKMSIESLENTLPSELRSNLRILYNVRKASSAMANNLLTPEVSRVFLESMQELKRLQPDCRVDNDLSSFAIKVSASMMKCENLQSLNAFYSDIKSVKELDRSLEIDFLLDSCISTYYVLLDSSITLDADHLTHSLAALVKMDKIGMNFDYNSQKLSIVLTAIGLIDSDDFTDALKSKALRSIKRLKITNPTVESCLEEHHIEDAETSDDEVPAPDRPAYVEEVKYRDNERLLSNGLVVKIVRKIIERESGAIIYEGLIPDIGKVCLKEIDDPNKFTNFRKETEIIQILNNNKINNYSLLPNFYGEYLQENKKVGMVLELCSQTLYKEFFRRKLNNVLYTDEEIRMIASNLMRGLVEIHNKMYCHGDITFTNLMRGTDNIIKIIDFDASLRIDLEGRPLDPPKKNTPAFLAPELVTYFNIERGNREGPNFDFRKSDVFSAGIVLLYIKILNDTILFNIQENRQLLAETISKIDILWLKNLLMNALEFDPDQRYDAVDCIQLLQEAETYNLSAPVNQRPIL